MEPLTNTQPSPVPPVQPIPPPSPPAVKHGHKLILFCLFVLVAAACAGGVYAWQHKKITSLNSQLTNLNAQLSDQQAAFSALPNIVDVASSGTADLTAFLGSDNTQCYKQPSSGKGWFKINKEVNDQFAQMQYGCQNSYSSSTPTHILAIKTNGQWALISPTNQWTTVNGVDYPSCTMINDNKISKSLEPKCAVQTTTNGTAQTTLQDVTNP